MINTNTVLGSLNHTFSTLSLQGHTTTTGATNDPPAVQPGTDLSHFVKVHGHSSNDPGFGPGTKTTHEIAGPAGTGIGNSEHSVKDLFSHHNWILPPH